LDKNEQKMKAKKAAGLRKAVQAGWGILSRQLTLMATLLIRRNCSLITR